MPSSFLMNPPLLLLSLFSTTFLLPFSFPLEEESPPFPTYFNAFQPSPETSIAPDSADSDPTLVLAPRRTYRKDPLEDFKMYTGGWNISNRHYWASVSYTAVPFFVVATIWFATFGLCLSLICLCYCCRRREPYGYSPIAYALSLIFLVLFSIAAIIGCVVLYTGQKRFHSSTINTLQYVVDQAEDTSDTLRNVSEHLVAAKQTNVVQVSLPPNVQTDIDQIQTMIDTSATTLTTKTEDNSRDIKKHLDSMRLALIVVTAVMLLLIFLGFGVPFYTHFFNLLRITHLLF